MAAHRLMTYKDSIVLSGLIDRQLDERLENVSLYELVLTVTDPISNETIYIPKMDTDTVVDWATDSRASDEEYYYEYNYPGLNFDRKIKQLITRHDLSTYNIILDNIEKQTYSVDVLDYDKNKYAASVIYEQIFDGPSGVKYIAPNHILFSNCFIIPVTCLTYTVKGNNYFLMSVNVLNLGMPCAFCKTFDFQVDRTISRGTTYYNFKNSSIDGYKIDEDTQVIDDISCNLYNLKLATIPNIRIPIKVLKYFLLPNIFSPDDTDPLFQLFGTFNTEPDKTYTRECYLNMISCMYNAYNFNILQDTTMQYLYSINISKDLKYYITPVSDISNIYKFSFYNKYVSSYNYDAYAKYLNYLGQYLSTFETDASYLLIAFPETYKPANIDIDSEGWTCNIATDSHDNTVSKTWYSVAIDQKYQYVKTI